jgi:hypothetical protein
VRTKKKLIKETAKEMSFGTVFGTKLSHYIIAGFSVVTALSWNNAVRECVETVAPTPCGKVCSNLIYAVIITLLLVILIYALPDTKAELPRETREKINQMEY